MNSNKHVLVTEMTFDAAHRLSNYEGKCKRIHGHTYKVLVEVSSDSLNEWGAVMDFGDLKKIMNEKIDMVYDHKLLLFIDDPLNLEISKNMPKDWIVWMNTNTSAENIAKDIFTEIAIILKVTHKNITLNKVAVYETPKNAAIHQE